MRTEFTKVSTLYLESLFKSWAGKSGTITATEAEHKLLEQHGWTYQEFVKENERALNEHMRKLEQGAKGLRKALKRINQ